MSLGVVVTIALASVAVAYVYDDQSLKREVIEREAKCREFENDRLRKENRELREKLEDFKNNERAFEIERFKDSKWYRLSLWEKFKACRTSGMYYSHEQGFVGVAYYQYRVQDVIPGINIREIQVTRLNDEKEDKFVFYKALDNELFGQGKTKIELEEK